jgi:hypothetical protein
MAKCGCGFGNPKHVCFCSKCGEFTSNGVMPHYPAPPENAVELAFGESPTSGIRENSDGKLEQRVALLEAIIHELITADETENVDEWIASMLRARKLVGRDGL